jgi:biotin carboxyl carrier protein
MTERRVFARSPSGVFRVDVKPGHAAVTPVTEDAATPDGATPPMQVAWQYAGHGRLRLAIDGRQVLAWAVEAGESRWVFLEGEVFEIGLSERAEGTRRRARRAGAESLSAPMPATVVRLLVTPGAAVTRGETLLLLEAMKMELPLRAPHDAVIRAVHCAEGDLVQPGRPLVDLE